MGSEESIQKYSTHHSDCICITMPYRLLKGGRRRGEGGGGGGRGDKIQIHSKEDANATLSSKEMGRQEHSCSEKETPAE